MSTTIDRTPELIKAMKGFHKLKAFQFKPFPKNRTNMHTTGFAYTGHDDDGRRASRHIKKTMEAMSIPKGAQFHCSWMVFYSTGKPPSYNVKLQRIHQ